MIRPHIRRFASLSLVIDPDALKTMVLARVVENAGLIHIILERRFTS